MENTRTTLSDPPPARFPRLWNVPFSSNQYFTGRDDLLAALYREATRGTSTILTHQLTGLAGVGKTRLAAEFAFRHRNDYDFVWWVRAAAPSSLKEDVARLGELLGVSSPHSRWTDAATSVRDWLESSTERWLLVFDDVDDLHRIERLLPTRGAGHVLITSRKAGGSGRPAGWSQDVHQFHVDVLSPEAAASFLLTKTASSDRSGAHNLAKNLGFLALALEQAAAFINVRGDTFKEYGRRLLGYTKDSDTSKGKYRLASGQEQRARMTLDAVCRLSVNTARRHDLQAGILLDYLSFVGPVPVAPALLKRLDPTLRLSMNPLRTLSQYSLIEFGADESVVVHPLVQALVERDMKPNRRMAVLHNLLDLMDEELPDDSRSPRNRAVLNRVAPHAEALLRKIADFPGQIKGSAQSKSRVSQQIARLFHKVGRFSEARGDIETAVYFFQQALSNLASSEGAGVGFADLVSNDLAVALAESGDWAQAVHIGAELVRGNAASASTDESDATRTVLISNIAAFLADAGRLQDAARFYSAILTRHADFHPGRTQLGPVVLTARHNWATVLEELGEFEQSIRIHREVLESKDEFYGREHPETVVSLLGLAKALAHESKNPEGIKLAMEAFRKAERMLGEYHPITLGALDSLAVLSLELGDGEGALVYAERALARRADALGKDNPLTLDALHTLAIISQRLGQTVAARELLERVVALRTTVLGAQHPKTVGAVKDLAGLRIAFGESAAVRRSRVVPKPTGRRPGAAAPMPTRGWLFDEAVTAVE
ncbi:tetratricopeptide repeat protein [Micromonospora wenchangensis]|uniref:tetratricopeptide repeat protein n=1 Tax=Micromonospora wenchangensis TaxID=1185415 RepID=UPI00341990C7